MKKNRVARLAGVAAQFIILIPAPGLTRAQSPTPQMAVRPPAPSETQRDPYADAFGGLTYTPEQKEVINKIKQDIAARKAAVLKDDKLTEEQKDAMLTGYTRIEHGLIFKELTPEQKSQVTTRVRASRQLDQSAQKTKAPTR